MKAHYPQTKSNYQPLDPLDENFYKIGDAGRRKIIRLYQYTQNPPPITAESTLFTPVFNYLSNAVSEVWNVQSQYSSCLWATQGDEQMATALLLHYGWVHPYRTPIPGPAIYKLEPQLDGVKVIIAQPHTFNDRLSAALLSAITEHSKFKAAHSKITYQYLYKTACQTFYSHKGYYVSLPQEYRQYVMGIMAGYCKRLFNVFDDQVETFPEIEEPEGQLDPETFLISYDTFATTRQRQAMHLTNIHANSCLKPLMEKTATLPLHTDIPRKILNEYITDANIQAAQKYGFIVKGSKRGLWQLNYERS